MLLASGCEFYYHHGQRAATPGCEKRLGNESLFFLGPDNAGYRISLGFPEVGSFPQPSLDALIQARSCNLRRNGRICVRGYLEVQQQDMKARHNEAESERRSKLSPLAATRSCRGDVAQGGRLDDLTT